MIVAYEDKYEEDVDDFVLNKSINGNFLQTRNFYNYHPVGRFKDASILFLEDGKIAAVIQAAEINHGKTLIAHPGSTYGGLIVSRNFANTNGLKLIFAEMLKYFKDKGYEKVELRMHNWLYSPDEKHYELLDYYFQLNGFTRRNEIGFYMDLSKLDEDYISHFEKLKKRKLNRAKKYGLTFRKLQEEKEIREYYDVLANNMIKFHTVPVHTIDELLDFYNKRLVEVTSFYGVFLENKIIAGSMVWNFCNKKVFHTQYLASLHEYLDYCPNEFLYSNLIQAAMDEGFRYLSYGTASLEHGTVYNESLGMYKEGFNTDSYQNGCYIWELK